MTYDRQFIDWKVKLKDSRLTQEQKVKVNDHIEENQETFSF